MFNRHRQFSVGVVTSARYRALQWLVSSLKNVSNRVDTVCLWKLQSIFPFWNFYNALLYQCSIGVASHGNNKTCFCVANTTLYDIIQSITHGILLNIQSHWSYASFFSLNFLCAAFYKYFVDETAKKVKYNDFMLEFVIKFKHNCK